VRGERPANDDQTVSLEEAIVLLEEIERLRAQLSSYEKRLSELDRLAYRDPLIDVPNRRSFFDRLESIVTRVDRHGGEAAMMFVDVDGLKAVNDKLGHNAGDKVLVQVARLLVESVRKDDFVARLAGDEFGILLDHCDELTAWQTALRVVETVDECRFQLDGVQLPLSVAVGVGVIHRGDTAEAVLARADKEMYRIKSVATRTPSAG
jgi:diguanylate cyclase (GGDEF)-like protein